MNNQSAATGWSSESSDSSGERFAIEVVTMSGRAVSIEFRFQTHCMEVWQSAHRCGVFDRSALQNWLASPTKPMVVGEAAFSLDRRVDQDGRVAVSLPDVLCWTLSPAALDRLKKQI